jgi:predicted transcriptional regulator
MAKRGKLEIIKDILKVIKNNRNSIKPTPLLRQSNISTWRFKEYYQELIVKELVKETNTSDGKIVSLTEKGMRFLDKYKIILDFIDEFNL